MIWLKPALQKTINECPPITLNKVLTKMKELLMMQTYWDLAMRISKEVYFFLRILHLGDSKEPGFDRLYYYYIPRMEQHLIDNKDEINLADMDCSDAKHMCSFLNRFFASGRVPLSFKCHQEEDDHKFVVREDPSKDDTPDDMPVPAVEEEGTGTTEFVQMLQKKGPNPKPLDQRLLVVFRKRTLPMKCKLAISGWLTTPVKQI